MTICTPHPHTHTLHNTTHLKWARILCLLLDSGLVPPGWEVERRIKETRKARLHCLRKIWRGSGEPGGSKREPFSWPTTRTWELRSWGLDVSFCIFREADAKMELEIQRFIRENARKIKERGSRTRRREVWHLWRKSGKEGGLNKSFSLQYSSEGVLARLMGAPDQRLPSRGAPCWAGMAKLRYPYHSRWLGAAQGGQWWVQSPTDAMVGPKELQREAVSYNRFSLEGRSERHAPMSSIDRGVKMALPHIPSWLQGWWSLLLCYRSIAALVNYQKHSGLKQHTFIIL